MRKFLASLVVVALVLMLLVPAVSFAGGRYGGHRGGGHHIGLGGFILGTALGVLAGEVVYNAFAPVYRYEYPPPVYYPPEYQRPAYREPAYRDSYYDAPASPPEVCYQSVPVYRKVYDRRTGECYYVRVGWRDVEVPCR